MLRILAGPVIDRAAHVAFETGHTLELPAQLSGRLGRLIVSVKEFQEVPIDARSRRIRKLSPSELESAYAFIHTNHTHVVRLAEIAAAVGLSPGHFSRAFHLSAGMTLTAYVLRTRLDTAMHLMRQTRRSLCDVALSSGFGDQSTFSRMFVRAHHITPSRWRRFHGVTEA